MRKSLKILLFPLFWVWRSMFFINAVLTFFLLYPFFFILLQREKWFKYVFLIKKFWAHLIIWPLGLFYRVRKPVIMDMAQPYVVCPNHTSYLDIMLIYIAIPFYFHTMGKAELLKVPLFRKFFERMNIPVNRKSKVDSHRAMMRAASDLDKGVSVTLFPEGTIYHNGPVMGRFKNGPFHLAIEKQVPILPVTFLNNWLLLPDDFQHRVGRPGIAEVIIHDPIPTTGMTMDDLDRLKQMTYDVINGPLKEKYSGWFPEK